jgi:outer membrane protein insertion porin family
MDMHDLRRSAGFGVRLLVNPIGMIGFDYGYGYDGATPKCCRSRMEVSFPIWKIYVEIIF